MMTDPVGRIRAMFESADGLLITAGAGMGVDSGLPDFRSDNGFWKAYPALALGGIRFEEIANPAAFHTTPRLAWGFYGHRLALYRRTVPHLGFHLLQEIAGRLEHGLFVFTSNVDGQFQRSGVPEGRVCEIHGSIHHLQCSQHQCDVSIWPADEFHPQIDQDSGRLINDLPMCPRCGSLARPNILMFNDASWDSSHTFSQEDRLDDWLKKVLRPVVIEIGAGIHIPTVRMFSNKFKRLVRINPTAPKVPHPTSVGLAKGGLEGIQVIHDLFFGKSAVESGSIK